MRWTDVFDIAIALDEQYSNKDPMALNFVDLRNMVLDLEGFEDDPSHCGEKILEAIQAAWIEESQ